MDATETMRSVVKESDNQAQKEINREIKQLEAIKKEVKDESKIGY